MPKRKSTFLLNLITILISLFIFFAGLEMVAYVIKYLKDGEFRSKTSYDKRVSWKPTENYSFNRTTTDAGGESYSVRYSTVENGFREWGNIDTDKPRVFFLGDSYTQAIQVSNEKAYFNVVKEKIPIEVFVFGCEGYGTLQEFLILDKYIDLIKPHVVILQFCSNDFENNSLDMESHAIVANQKIRPYWVDGEIIYRNSLSWEMYKFFLCHFKIFRFFDEKILQMKFKKFNGYHYPSKSAEEDEMRQRHFIQSLNITEELISKFKRRIPENSYFIAFNSDTDEPNNTYFKGIAEKNDIDVMASVPIAIEKASKQKKVVFAMDGGHWNNLGHKIVGMEIAKHLSEHYELVSYK